MPIFAVRKFIFMTKLYCLLMGFAMFLSQDLSAQTKEVTGKVVSAVDSSALADVTVKVKNSPLSTVTDADGTFRISAPSNATTLVFSYVGFETQEVAVNNLSVVDVELVARQSGERQCRACDGAYGAIHLAIRQQQ